MDRDIIKQCQYEMLSEAGGMLSVQILNILLNSLDQRFGEQLTIKGVCSALDQLMISTQFLKKDLAKHLNQESEVIDLTHVDTEHFLEKLGEAIANKHPHIKK